MIRRFIISGFAALTSALIAGEEIKISVGDAIMMGLENNSSLKVQRFAPAVMRTYEKEARAEFDPVLRADAARQDTDSRQILTRSSGTLTNLNEKNITGFAGIEETLPTGTRLTAGGSANLLNNSIYAGDFDSTRAGVSVTQSLLKGFGTGANLASLRQARIDTRISEYELRGFTEQLVASIESACWDYMLAGKQVDIFKASMDLAEKQLAETKERIALGGTAKSELPAAEAEAAARKQELIAAQGALESSRINLIHLISPSATNAFELGIVISETPAITNAALDAVTEHVKLAMKNRPDLNQARLKISRNELEIVRTKNGLLPKLDLFMRYGNTGYGSSFSESSGNINGDYTDLAAGIQFEYQIGDRASAARNERAKAGKEQAEEALKNLSQLVELDVRNAYIDFKTAKERAIATGATRRFREEALTVESEKFRVGKSTSLLVAQTQRDLLVAQIQELYAAINCIKSLISLYRLEGSLLERRGLVVSANLQD